MTPKENAGNLFDRIRLHSWMFLILWTGCITASLLWNLYEQREKIFKIARNNAQVTFENDVLYRKWAAKQGGVYVPVSDHTPPNPYLNLPNRDITTSSGLSLTLVNPAYMARQVNQMAADIHGSQGHITSLNPLRPENAPDSWEAGALKSFAGGMKEVSSIEKIADEEYMRLMRPFVAEKACLKCHASQGYKEGDIRGGISVSIPMAPLWAIEKPLIAKMSIAHFLLWIAGIAGILISQKALGKEVFGRERAEAGLKQEKDFLNNLVDTANDAIVSAAQDGKILLWNPAAGKIFGYPSSEAVGHRLEKLIVPERSESRFQKALAERFSKDTELELKRKGGNQFFAEVSFSSGDRAGESAIHTLIVKDISERKQAEQAVLRAKLEWERTFDALPDLIAIMDDRHRILRANRAMAERLRLTPDQCVGKICYEVLHGLDRPPDFCPHALTVADGRQHVAEVHEERLGGDFLVSTTPLSDDQGQHIGSVHVARDISAHKQTEKELEKLASVVRHSSEFVNLATLDGKMIFLNEAGARIVGLSPEEVEQTHILQVISEHLKEKAQYEVLPALKTKGFWEGELQYRNLKTGRLTDVQAITFTIKDPLTGMPLYLANTSRDITERKKIEQALQESEEKFKLIATNTPDHILMQDADLRYVWVLNPQLGLTEKDMIGRTDFDFLSKEDAMKITQIKKKVLATGNPENVTVPLVSSGGDLQYFEGTYIPKHNFQGQIDGIIGYFRNVTTRMKMEEELRRSRDELELRVQERTADLKRQAELLDLAHDAIVVREMNGRITFWNDGATEMYGWTKEEALGKTMRDLLQTQFPLPREAIMNEVVQKGRWEGEMTHTLKDGKKIHVLSRWALQRNEGGEPTAVMQINNDITERKRAEETLRSSAMYARRLIEASLDPLVTISPEGKITDVNRATELVTGTSRDDLIGSDFSNYFTDPEKAREGYEQVFLKGTVRDYPLAIRHVSGVVTEVLYNATVYRNESGKVQGVFAAARDITQRKAAEQERMRLATAIEQIADGVAIMDMGGRILYTNPAFDDQHGLRREEIPGRSYDDLLQASLKDVEFPRKMREALGLRGVWNGHLTQRRQNVSICELEVTISPIRGPWGAPINYVAVHRDVTQVVKLEERIRQGQKMEALGTLAGGIAHDFNNLLMPIILNTEGALWDIREGNLPPVDNLHMVIEAAERGQKLVKQILAFSRQKEQTRKTVEITPIIKEALKFLRSTIPTSIEIREAFEAESATVLADPTQIHQVLMNLCSNAAHAMREKGGILGVSLAKVEVDVDMAAQHVNFNPGPYLRLTVKDIGQGMNREVRERAFDPFFTTKKPGEGTGMGLAVVHGIVKNHEGAITLESEVGKGTTVNVFLPLVQRSCRGGEGFSEGPLPGGKERILVVDDEEMQVRSVQGMLERLGYRVMGKTDPREALEIFRTRPDAFDLVILDQTMPHMNGNELARELLCLRSDLPIILCTGFSEVIDGKAAMAQGIQEFALKPLTSRDLAERIRRGLGK